MEAVLTGSEAALPGLIEILESPHWGHCAINQHEHNKIMFEGSRLQPGDALDVLGISYPWVSGEANLTQG